MEEYIHRVSATPPAYWDDMKGKSLSRKTWDDMDHETAAEQYRFLISEEWRDITVEAYKPAFTTVSDPASWFA